MVLIMFAVIVSVNSSFWGEKVGDMVNKIYELSDLDKARSAYMALLEAANPTERRISIQTLFDRYCVCCGERMQFANFSSTVCKTPECVGRTKQR